MIKTTVQLMFLNSALFGSMQVLWEFVAVVAFMADVAVIAIVIITLSSLM